MKIENNQIIVDERDLASALPFNDNMSKAECYSKGMLDFAEAVRAKVDNARLAREQHSYMYHGYVLASLIDELEHLTHSVITFKRG